VGEYGEMGLASAGFSLPIAPLGVWLYAYFIDILCV
jgi:hypothetical protein